MKNIGKKLLKLLVIIITFSVVLLIIFSFYMNYENYNKISLLELNVDTLTKENNHLKESNSKLEEQNNKLSSENKKLDGKVKDSTKELEKFSTPLYGDPGTLKSEHLGNINYLLGDEEALEENEYKMIADKDTISKTPIIYGHNAYYGSKLSKIKKNEIISLTDDKGIMNQYQVNDIKIIDANETLKLKDGQMALYTCYPFDATHDAPSRYVVYAKKIY